MANQAPSDLRTTLGSAYRKRTKPGAPQPSVGIPPAATRPAWSNGLNPWARAESLTSLHGGGYTPVQEGDFATRRSGEAMLGESFRLQGIEDDRFRSASERLTRSVNQLPQTFSDADFQEFFRNEFAMGASNAAEGSFGDFAAARSRLGVGGFTGGGIAAGLGQQAELKRLREVRDTAARAKVDLKKAKMQADANDALRNMEAEFQLANFNNQSPSLLGLDALTNQTEIDLTRLGLFLGREAAGEQAKAAKKAGKDALFGSGLSGVLGLAGSIFA